MPPAPIPSNEHERLAALRRQAILDTTDEERFDRITRIVTHVLDVPIALISFVDADRQWLKSRVGIAVRESSRDHAFCAHTILDDEGMVVEDAMADPRFNENPFVRAEGGIRFYAGAPIRTSDGQLIGSVCGIDRRSRRISLAQRAALKDLASLVSDELELRLAEARLTQELDRRRAAEDAREHSERRVQDFLETASDWLWETDAEHRFIYLSREADKVLDRDRAIGLTRWELTGDDLESDVWRSHRADLAARRAYRAFRYTMRRADGRKTQLEVSGNPRFAADGTFLGYRGTGRDRTSEAQTESVVLEMGRSFDILARNGTYGIIQGQGPTILDANDAFLQMLGYDRVALEGGRLPWSAITPPEWDELDQEAWQVLISTGSVGPLEKQYFRKDGTRVPISVRAVLTDAATERWVAFIEDITVRKNAEAEIRQLAFRDSLTGLANRRSFDDRLNETLFGRTDRQRSGALILLDLDHFKSVNDMLGHDAGDALLREVADRLRACIRPQDVASRLGGDEFAVILAAAESTAEITAVAKRLLDRIGRSFVYAGHVLRPAASMGITVFPKDGQEPAELMKRADLALYRSKAQGRGTLSYFDPTMLPPARTGREPASPPGQLASSLAAGMH